LYILIVHVSGVLIVDIKAKKIKNIDVVTSKTKVSFYQNNL